MTGTAAAEQTTYLLRLHLTTVYGEFSRCERFFGEVVVLEVAPALVSSRGAEQGHASGSYLVATCDDHGNESVRQGNVSLAQGRALVDLFNRCGFPGRNLAVASKFHTAEGDLLFRMEVTADDRHGVFVVSLTAGYEGADARVVAQLAHAIADIVGTEPNRFHQEHLPGTNEGAVLDHVEGQSLHNLVREQGPLPITRAVAIVRAAAVAIAHQHRAGIIHRELSPRAIMVRGDDTVVVADPDIAMAAAVHDPGAPATRSVGPHYASPELLLDHAPVDGRSDQFALGVIAFEALTGQRPHTGDTTVELVGAIVSTPAPDVRELRPEVPHDVAAAVARMLEKDPAARFPDLDAAAAAIEPVR